MVNQAYNVANTANPFGTQEYGHHVFQFTATGITTRLSFEAGTPATTQIDTNGYGPALDDISVVAVPIPEPSSFMLSFIALAGFTLRRKR